MVAEKSYLTGQAQPDVVIGWGYNRDGDVRSVMIGKADQHATLATNDDTHQLDRMIATLKRARRFLRNG